MKNKLFLALSLLTVAFSVSADYANQASQPGRFASYWTAVKNGAYSAYTTSTKDIVDGSIAGAQSAYNSSKAYATENPYTTVGFAAGAAALVIGTVVAYKKGCFKNPFAKAKALDTKPAKDTKPANKKAKKAFKKPVVFKNSGKGK